MLEKSLCILFHASRVNSVVVNVIIEKLKGVSEYALTLFHFQMLQWIHTLQQHQQQQQQQQRHQQI